MAVVDSHMVALADRNLNVPYRACSAVGRAQGLVPQGSGFDPDLFHKAWYMPFTCRWRFEIKLGILNVPCESGIHYPSLVAMLNRQDLQWRP